MYIVSYLNNFVFIKRNRWLLLLKNKLKKKKQLLGISHTIANDRHHRVSRAKDTTLIVIYA